MIISSIVFIPLILTITILPLIMTIITLPLIITIKIILLIIIIIIVITTAVLIIISAVIAIFFAPLKNNQPKTHLSRSPWSPAARPNRPRITPQGCHEVRGESTLTVLCGTRDQRLRVLRGPICPCLADLKAFLSGYFGSPLGFILFVFSASVSLGLWLFRVKSFLLWLFFLFFLFFLSVISGSLLGLPFLHCFSASWFSWYLWLFLVEYSHLSIHLSIYLFICFPSLFQYTLILLLFLTSSG